PGFFFQAEDGIRDFHVTGVQTCALPISIRRLRGDCLPIPNNAGGDCQFIVSIGILKVDGMNNGSQTAPNDGENPMTRRDVVFPPARQALYERNRYSPAVRSNGFLFVSGQVGSLEDGSPEPELERQVSQAFVNLNAILAAAGCSFEDVVDVTVFMVDPESRFERIW